MWRSLDAASDLTRGWCDDRSEGYRLSANAQDFRCSANVRSPFSQGGKDAQVGWPMVKICQYEQLQQLQRLSFSRFECRALISHVLSWLHRARERERENNSSILPTLSETFFFLLPCSIGFMAPNGNKAFSWGAVCCVWVEVPKGRHWRPYPFL